jgi:uncharacterized membrane protein YbhN (UPF0104 family)
MLILRTTALILLGGAVVLFRGFIADALGEAVDAGWRFFLLFPLFIAWSIPAVAAWQLFLRASPRPSVPGIFRLLVVRLEALALSFSLPTGGVGGDVARTVLTHSGTGYEDSAPPVVLDRAAFAFAEVFVALLGLVIYAMKVTVSIELWIAGVLGTFGFLAAVLTWRAILRLALRVPWLRKNKTVRNSLGQILTHTAYRKAFFRAGGLHFLERIGIFSEIWVVGWMLGTVLTPVETLFAGALTSFFGFAFFFMPGQIGAYESGLLFGFSLLGLPASTGLGIAFLRRSRQLGITGIGYILLVLERRRSGLQQSRHTAAGR